MYINTYIHIYTHTYIHICIHIYRGCVRKRASPAETTSQRVMRGRGNASMSSALMLSLLPVLYIT